MPCGWGELFAKGNCSDTLANRDANFISTNDNDALHILNCTKAYLSWRSTLLIGLGFQLKCISCSFALILTWLLIWYQYKLMGVRQ